MKRKYLGTVIVVFFVVVLADVVEARVVYGLREAGSLRPGDVLLIRDMAEWAEGHPGGRRVRTYVAPDGHEGTVVTFLTAHAPGIILPWPRPGRFVLLAGALSDTRRLAVQFGTDQEPHWCFSGDTRPAAANEVHEIVLGRFDVSAAQVPLRIRIEAPPGGTLAYVKVLLYEEPDWPKSLITGTRRVLIDNDGSSCFFLNMFLTPAAMDRTIAMYRDTDIRGMVWCVNTPLEVNYRSRIAPLMWEGVRHFPRRGDKRVHDAIRRFIDAGTDTLDAAIASCRRNHILCYAGLRMNAAPNPTYDEGRSFPLYERFKAMRLYETAEKRSRLLSYAFPEWRRHVESLLQEMAARHPDVILMEFTRIPPFVGRHPALVAEFRRRYGLSEADPIDGDDPRWLALTCRPLTTLVRRVRADLDAMNRAQPDQPRVRLAAHVFHRDDTSTYGLPQTGIDIDTWLEEGLLDELIVSSQRAYMDLSPWKIPAFAAKAKQLGIPVYCQIDSHFGGHDPTPAEDRARAAGRFVASGSHNVTPFYYRYTALDFYRQGADGVFIWDGFFNLGSTYRLGHRDDLDVWFRYEVPASRVRETLRFPDLP